MDLGAGNDVEEPERVPFGDFDVRARVQLPNGEIVLRRLLYGDFDDREREPQTFEVMFPEEADDIEEPERAGSPHRGGSDGRARDRLPTGELIARRPLELEFDNPEEEDMNARDGQATAILGMERARLEQQERDVHSMNLRLQALELRMERLELVENPYRRTRHLGEAIGLLGLGPQEEMNNWEIEEFVRAEEENLHYSDAGLGSSDGRVRTR